MELYLHIVLILQVYLCIEGVPFDPPNVEDVAYWKNMGQSDLKEELTATQNVNIAKNVILFIGDGMGVTTVTAARILKGQLQGQSGEEAQLSFEKFPHVSMIKVYNTNAQGPDSAGTATAFLSGVKTRSGVIGVGPDVQRYNCSSQHGQHLTSILDWSLAEGKSVGIVTTTRVTHATPAATYAHSADRNWEGDASMGSNTPACKDIADQLISDNKDIQVILGGGRRFFIRNDEPDPVTGSVDSTNGRKDGRNLMEWKADKVSRNKSHSFVLTKGEFEAVNPRSTDYLMGLFKSSHMDYDILRPDGADGQPSLTEMTDKALRILSKNDKGFFLLVEGGRIDHGHHGGRAKRALYDTLAFEEAVQRAVNITSRLDTLIVATADHSHVFTVGGYQSRGNPILGVSDNSSPKDGSPMTPLLYGNGPGFISPRPDISAVDTEADTYRQQAAVPLSSETHSSEDVTAYAIGPMASLFQGVKEQSYIAHAMAYASCVGDNKEHCMDNGGSEKTAARISQICFAVVMSLLSWLTQ